MSARSTWLVISQARVQPMPFSSMSSRISSGTAMVG